MFAAIVKYLTLLQYIAVAILVNGTARFKNVNKCLNTNISYLETSGGQKVLIYI
jgi:hypothetical protein